MSKNIQSKTACVLLLLIHVTFQTCQLPQLFILNQNFSYIFFNEFLTFLITLIKFDILISNHLPALSLSPEFLLTLKFFFQKIDRSE